MNLSVLTDLIVSQVSAWAYCRQVLTVLAVFLYGYVCVSFLCPSCKIIRRAVLAFPAGLGLFSVSAFLLLVLSVPYNVISVVTMCVLAEAGIVFCAVRFGKTDKKAYIAPDQDLKKMLLLLAVVVLAAAFACSGVLKISLSNDSVYNYSFYPRLLVYFGKLRVNYDVFLTDVGQGTALINTLPFLFGFEESFGLQHMLNFSFLAAFWMALYERTDTEKKALRILLPCAGVLLLLSALPYLILSKWILANDYFAVFMFLCTVLIDDVRYRDGVQENTDMHEELRLLWILVPALSLLRIEGGVFVAFFVLCASTQRLGSRDLVFGMLVPSMILQGLYTFKIFCTMEITAPYAFLTPKKAGMMLLLMAFVLLYLLFVRNRRFLKIQSHLGLLIIAALCLINLLLLIRDPGAYFGNLKAFLDNLLYRGGWGLLPATVVALYLVSIRRSFRFGYTDLMAFGYFLYVLAVSFMREGDLHPGVGDSGNRVLLQVVPLLLFAALSHVLPLIKEQDR